MGRMAAAGPGPGRRVRKSRVLNRSGYSVPVGEADVGDPRLIRRSRLSRFAALLRVIAGTVFGVGYLVAGLFCLIVLTLVVLNFLIGGFLR